MASQSTNRWLLAGGALLVTVLLFLAPRVTDSSAEKPVLSEQASALGELVTRARTFLPEELKSEEETYLGMVSSSDPSQKLAALDSLVNFWLANGQPAVAATFAEQSAVESDDAAQWKAAGDLYLMAARNSKPENSPTLYNAAIRSFETAFGKGLTDLDARVDLGTSYVEGTPEAMKGIGIIREVLQADSNNIKAQLSLAYFSIRSGQHEKAIERFNRVLELDPEFYDAHVYLGDLYERTGDISNAISHYEVYREHVEDPEVVVKIDEYLVKLRNKLTL